MSWLKLSTMFGNSNRQPKARTRRKAQVGLDQCEDRQLLATFLLMSPGGDWNLDATWQGSGVPTVTDDVVLNDAGTLTIPAGVPFNITNFTVTGSAAKFLNVDANLNVTNNFTATTGSPNLTTTMTGTADIVVGGNISTASAAVTFPTFTVNNAVIHRPISAGRGVQSENSALPNLIFDGSGGGTSIVNFGLLVRGNYTELASSNVTYAKGSSVSFRQTSQATVTRQGANNPFGTIRFEGTDGLVLGNVGVQGNVVALQANSVTGNITFTGGFSDHLLIGSGAVFASVPTITVPVGETVEARSQLAVRGDWINDGTVTFNSTSNIQFAPGPNAATAIKQPLSQPFNSVIFNRSGPITLTNGTDIQINGTLIVQQLGNLIGGDLRAAGAVTFTTQTLPTGLDLILNGSGTMGLPQQIATTGVGVLPNITIAPGTGFVRFSSTTTTLVGGLDNNSANGVLTPSNHVLVLKNGPFNGGPNVIDDPVSVFKTIQLNYAGGVSAPTIGITGNSLNIVKQVNGFNGTINLVGTGTLTSSDGVIPSTPLGTVSTSGNTAISTTGANGALPNLIVAAGASTLGNAKLVGNLTVNGGSLTADPGTTLTIAPPASTTRVIGGSGGTISLRGLTINGSSNGVVQLARNLPTVAGDLTIGTGEFDMANFTVNVTGNLNFLNSFSTLRQDATTGAPPLTVTGTVNVTAGTVALDGVTPGSAPYNVFSFGTPNPSIITLGVTPGGGTKSVAGNVFSVDYP